MSELFTILLIGISLSMDTFSLSLAIGTLKITKKNIITISLIVGIFHFIMPIIGLYFGEMILQFIKIDHKYIVSFIFMLIALEMIHSVIKKEEDVNIKTSIVGIILFSLAVSMDSLGVGIGLNIITTKTVLAASIFSITSFIFTYTGLNIGKYLSNKYSLYGRLIGAIILIILSLTYIFK